MICELAYATISAFSCISDELVRGAILGHLCCGVRCPVFVGYVPLCSIL
jgi:hypothetical protein